MNVHLKNAGLMGLTLMVTLAGGCNRRPDARPDKPVIAVVMKSLANEFFKTMEDGAIAHQKNHADHYDLLTVGIKDELDVAQQINLVEQMVAQRVAAIVLAPADSKSLVSVCKTAHEAGVVVVNIDNRLDGDIVKEKGLVIPFVGPDNRKGAALAGEYLAGKLSPGDPVAIIEGAPNAYNAMQRKLGFEDAMNAAGVKIIASQTANWETDKANQVAAALITEHPDLKAVLCANDSMALGAVAALRTAGRSDTVMVIGYDNISAVQSLLQEGKMLCTIDQHADQLAVFGIDYALDILSGKAAPADKETPVDLVTADSLK